MSVFFRLLTFFHIWALTFALVKDEEKLWISFCHANGKVSVAVDFKLIAWYQKKQPMGYQSIVQTKRI